MERNGLKISSAKTSPQPSADPLAALWAAMVTCFGQRWAQSMGDTPPALARSLLGPLTMQQVERMVRHVMGAGSPFPPTLPELAAVVRQGPSEEEAEALAYRLIPSFERQNCTRQQLEAIARANLARARELLAGAAPTAREANVLKVWKDAAKALAVVDEFLSRA